MLRILATIAGVSGVFLLAGFKPNVHFPVDFVVKQTPTPPLQLPTGIPKSVTIGVGVIVGAYTYYQLTNKLISLYRDLRNARVEIAVLRREDMYKPAEVQLGSTCIVCWDKPRNVVHLPCRHMSLCSSCEKKLQDLRGARHCPACRASIDQSLVVMLP